VGVELGVAQGLFADLDCSSSLLSVCAVLSRSDGRVGCKASLSFFLRVVRSRACARLLASAS